MPENDLCIIRPRDAWLIERDRFNWAIIALKQSGMSLRQYKCRLQPAGPMGLPSEGFRDSNWLGLIHRIALICIEDAALHRRGSKIESRGVSHFGAEPVDCDWGNFHRLAGCNWFLSDTFHHFNLTGLIHLMAPICMISAWLCMGFPCFWSCIAGRLFCIVSALHWNAEVSRGGSAINVDWLNLDFTDV